MNYWLLRYLFIFFLLFSFIIDFELFWIIFIYASIHLYLGLLVIFKDYVHFDELRYFFSFLIKLMLVFIFDLILEIIF